MVLWVRSTRNRFPLLSLFVGSIADPAAAAYVGKMAEISRKNRLALYKIIKGSLLTPPPPPFPLRALS